METSQPRGKYFEELSLGQKIYTAGRTVTEADVVSFAGLSGDFSQIHVDARYAAQGFFGQRVAHGLLVLSIISGLAVQTGVMDRTVIAFREIAEWKFSKPVFFGDTVRGEMEDEPRQKRFWRNHNHLRATPVRGDAGHSRWPILQVQDGREGLPRPVRRRTGCSKGAPRTRGLSLRPASAGLA